MSDTVQKRADDYIAQMKNARRLRRQVLTKACEFLRETGVKVVVLSYFGMRESERLEIYALEKPVPLTEVALARRDFKIVNHLTEVEVPQDLKLVRDKARGAHWFSHANNMWEWLCEMLPTWLPAGYDVENGSEGFVVLDVLADNLQIHHGEHHIQVVSQVLRIDKNGDETWHEPEEE